MAYSTSSLLLYLFAVAVRFQDFAKELPRGRLGYSPLHGPAVRSLQMIEAAVIEGAPPIKMMGGIGGEDCDY